MNRSSLRFMAVGFPLALQSFLCSAGDQASAGVFTLGQLAVSAPAADEQPLATATLDSEQLWNFNKDSLPDALNLIPGVSATPGSGQRNEAAISVRGFGRWQVPLYMDGIRLYLPADNRIDFDRFLTPDLAEIQVSKGYVSVLNGPDGMGGAINLVTRKPTRELEGELRGSAYFSNDGRYNGNTTYASIGSRQQTFYLQANAQQRDIDQWYLADDFKVRNRQYEDGGKRENSGKEDWRVGLKFGFTPNDTDEYSLNYVKQEGEKTRASSTRSNTQWWDWPKWNVESLYWLSHTQLGEHNYLKSRAYYNEFVNDLVAYRNDGTRNWTSYYDDNAMGASLEFGTTFLPGQTLKLAAHWRRDEHDEWQLTHSSGFVEPKHTNQEDIVSIALEDTWHITPRLDLVLGISRDERSTDKAEDYRAGDGLFTQPTSDSHASNYQGALIYRYRDSGKVNLSVSDRTRFPTIFERFSSRFGGAISNPALEPERALNIELAISDQILPGLRGEAAIFHNRVKDAIHSLDVWYDAPDPADSGWFGQNRNLGEATYKGFELALSAELSSSLQVGGNYSYIDSEVDDPNDSAARLETSPRHSAFAYAIWQAGERLRLLPSLEYAADRWSSFEGGYRRTGEYLLLGARLEYDITPDWQLALSGRNLLDKDYETSVGYPQEGRNFIVASRWSF
ncbi:TonB-dependent receptor plug domain-containing protein [Stutzerimonas kirkiae]|uniref:TonB-dependent receptor plug domain-containing protein n=1 Tax=Stutzerimonas kirkiae TaxID=2211392 RepID=UPI0010385CDD|nr:TonB-dependent receptor [Stutzerimonas kirkiae]TBV09670.1 TonB-dependent receptor [Stutzerimonas kirkiae]TBV16797.1 TonB-dependent receptor [Stutzerimonas kirkiae]